MNTGLTTRPFTHTAAHAGDQSSLTTKTTRHDQAAAPDRQCPLYAEKADIAIPAERLRALRTLEAKSRRRTRHSPGQYALPTGLCVRCLF